MESRFLTKQLEIILEASQKISIDELSEILYQKNQRLNKPVPQKFSLFLENLKQFFELLIANNESIGADDLVKLVNKQLKLLNDHTLFNHDVLAKLSILVDLCTFAENSYRLTTLYVAIFAHRKKYILPNNHLDFQKDQQIQRNYESEIRKKIDAANPQNQEAQIFKRFQLEQACFEYTLYLQNEIKKSIPKKHDLSHRTRSPRRKSRFCLDDPTDFAVDNFIIEFENKSIPETVQLAIEKYKILIRLQEILNNPDPNLSLTQKLSQFEQQFNEAKPILKKRRDNPTITFLKIIGSIITLCTANSFLWKIEGSNFAKKVCSIFSTPRPAEKKEADPCKQSTSTLSPQ